MNKGEFGIFGGTMGVPSRDINFTISARDLPMRERPVGGTTQDPYIKCYSKDKTQKGLTVLGETKHKVNDRNPDFHETIFTFHWMQGQEQVWRFHVMDFDILNKDDPIGTIDVKVDDFVMNSKDKAYSVKLNEGQGTLVIRECLPVKFRLGAKSLPKLDAFQGLSDPYVQCFWTTNETEAKPILFHTTKVIKNVEECKWDEEILFANFQRKANQSWIFKVFDKDIGKDDSLGEVKVSVDEFVNSQGIFLCNLSMNKGDKSVLIISPLA